MNSVSTCIFKISRRRLLNLGLFQFLIVALCIVGAYARPQTLVRTPQHDSAIIQHHRLGDNFAYSVAESHAYGVQTPIVQQRVVPVGVRHVQGTPIVKKTVSYAHQPITTYTANQPITYNTGVIPSFYSAGGVVPTTNYYAPNFYQYAHNVPLVHGFNQFLRQ